MQTGRIILASASAARAKLLTGAGLVFEVQVAGVDETAVKTAARTEGTAIEEVALTLARLKARAINTADALIIGADQMLICGNQWFDKPASPAAAQNQLRALRGRTHELPTAVVCIQNGVELWRHVARPRLTMRPFSDAFLDAYLAMEGDQVTQSVGGYRLEGPGSQLFNHVEGEHAAVLGLPILPLLQFLREIGTLMA